MNYEQESLTKYVPYRGEVLDLEKEISKVIDSCGLSLFECGKTEEEAEAYVRQNLQHLQKWIQHFATKQNDGPLSLKERLKMSVKESSSRVQVLEVADIEECIWSPQYGLKGRVDASLVIKAPPNVFRPKKKRSSTIGSSVYFGRSPEGCSSDAPFGSLHPSESDTDTTLIVPLELKTGKPYFTHQAQVRFLILSRRLHF